MNTTQHTSKSVVGVRFGFTLPEMMVAMFLGFGVIAGALTAFSYQQRSAEASRAINEMNQNVRSALEAIAREARMTGYGLNIFQDDLSDWINFAETSTSVPITMDQNPVVLDGASGAPDILAVAGSFDPPVATLSVAASAGSTTLALSGSGATNFNTSAKRVLFIGRCETARVVSRAGNILTISTDPTSSSGLKYSYPVGTTLELVKVLVFEPVRENAYSYPREPHLIRYDRSQTWVIYSWQRMLSSYIEDVQYTLNGDNTMTITVQGRTSKESPFYTDPNENDGFRRVTMSTTICFRNME